jgi:DNA-directed RNA polymerase specialized sigma24 family protein
VKRKPDAEMFAIVRDCLAGSKKARTTLWHQIEVQIVRCCYLPKLGRLAQDVDARREVFVRVMEDLDPVGANGGGAALELLLQQEGTVKFWTWIFTLATWRAIDVVRAHDQQIGGRKEYKWINELSLEIPVGGEGDGEYTDRPLPVHDEWLDRFDWMMWSEVIDHVIKHASDRTAAWAFIQFYVVGLSWQKIAASFAMAPDTIRMRVMRMVEELKRRLVPDAARAAPNGGGAPSTVSGRRRAARGTGTLDG